MAGRKDKAPTDLDYAQLSSYDQAIQNWQRGRQLQRELSGQAVLEANRKGYIQGVGQLLADTLRANIIDAGDPASPIGLESFPNGGIINMGAYGGTAEASKSYFGEPPCETIVAGDINGDCKVDFKDFALMAFHWLEEH
jgi:hypothetical protein